jgi:hypothetical protein
MREQKDKIKWAGIIRRSHGVNSSVGCLVGLCRITLRTIQMAIMPLGTRISARRTSQTSSWSSVQPAQLCRTRSCTVTATSAFWMG